MISTRPWFVRMSILTLTVMVFILSARSGGLVMAQPKERVIQITAKKFEYSPKDITLKKGERVVLEFTSLDRLHGFSCPGLGIRTDIPPGKVTQLRFTPDKVGTFPFHCDNFCGSGHEGMKGTITVTE